MTHASDEVTRRCHSCGTRLMSYKVPMTIEGRERQVREYVCPLCQPDRANQIDYDFAQDCRDAMVEKPFDDYEEPPPDPRPTPRAFYTAPTCALCDNPRTPGSLHGEGLCCPATFGDVPF